VKATVRLDTGSAEVEFIDCVAYASGEFAGNIDCSVKCGPEVSLQDIAEHLKLSLPGGSELLDLLGSGEVRGGYDLTYHSRELRGADTGPTHVEAYWVDRGMQRLGGIPCEAGSDWGMSPGRR